MIEHCMHVGFAIVGGVITGLIVSLFVSPSPAFDDEPFWEVPEVTVDEADAQHKQGETRV